MLEAKMVINAIPHPYQICGMATVKAYLLIWCWLTLIQMREARLQDARWALSVTAWEDVGAVPGKEILLLCVLMWFTSATASEAVVLEHRFLHCGGALASFPHVLSVTVTGTVGRSLLLLKSYLQRKSYWGTGPIKPEWWKWLVYSPF